MPKQNSPKPGSAQALPSSLSEILNSDKEGAQRFAEASKEAQEEQEIRSGIMAMLDAYESLEQEDDS